MPDFLLEIRTEDMPARFLPAAQSFLEHETQGFLESNKISGSRAQVWVTPRRLAIFIPNLKEQTEAETKMVYGPKTDSLKNAQGEYWPAVAGFARSKGLSLDKLRLEPAPQGSRVVAIITQHPRKTANLLKDGLPAIVLSIPFPKTMRWNSQGVRFARPIREITAFWGNKLLKDWRWPLLPECRPVPWTWVDGKKINLKSAGDYARRMQKAGLVFNNTAKKEALTKFMNQAAAPARPVSLDFFSLLEETMLLVEKPQPLLGSFDELYLLLPKEVILAILAKVKIFGVENNSGNLVPRFLTLAQKSSAPAVKNIRRGYERLVAAKLFDAKFFWEQDQKNSLESHAAKLKGIIWSRGLGSLWDKVERVRMLVQKLVTLAGARQDLASLDRAVMLYRADLATSLVGEYPDLAGRVGSYYARSSGETKAVALAIAEASEQDDANIHSAPGAILSVSDRLDTLLAQFSVGNRPGAKEDPLGLKKTADTVLEIFTCPVFSGAPLTLKQAIGITWTILEQTPMRTAIKISATDVCAQLLDYFKGRLALRLKEEGSSPDRVEAVLGIERFADLPVADILACLKAFNSLEASSQEAIFNLAQTFKRAANILRQAQKEFNLASSNGSVEPALFEHASETALWEKLTDTETFFVQSLSVHAYGQALKRLSELAGPLEAFFTGVMVLCDNERVKKNRLAMLAKLRHLVLQVLDPAKLTIKG